MSRPTRVPRYLKDELAELRKDKARLDWYEGNADLISLVVGVWRVWRLSGVLRSAHDTLREAIDAAMEAE